MGTEGETTVLFETKAGAVWVFPAVMAVALLLVVLGGRPRTDALGTVVLVVLGAFMAFIAVVVKKSWFRLYADRIEHASLTGTAKVLWFRDVEEAVLREAPFGGGPTLKVRSTTGEVLSWDANPKHDDDGHRIEKKIKAVYEALVAYGVEVDSLNYMRTGPFRMWRV
ncbi:hypothetical protein [Frigoribacterium faeni]|uniref:hypothetical protein n=1 Tax=Frigoribacterium faeni TaxID=145483 RepID=UPI00141B082B|nr:hypothetical protein [Frigoribacterium faeni]NIJ05477.1 hypothetical protein [Frigoribacterium faeni]